MPGLLGVQVLEMMAQWIGWSERYQKSSSLRGHAGGTGGHIILKCDGARSMLAMRDAVAKFHGGIVVPESPAKNESPSNGYVEGAGRIVREFTRVFKFQIEGLARIEIESTDNILQWAVRWAAMVCSRYLVGADGKTGWERRRGRPCRLPVVRFGEKVWYQQIRDGKQKRHHLETEWREGLWLGHTRNTNEVLIGNRDGVVRAYTVKRQEIQNQWDGAMIKEMRGTPRQPDPNREGQVILTKINFDPETGEALEETDAKRKELDIRRMRITPIILLQYGYTEGCEGCRYKKAGFSDGRNHSERCMARIFEAMEKTVEGRRAFERDGERLNERMERAHNEMEGGNNVDLADGSEEPDVEKDLELGEDVEMPEYLTETNAINEFDTEITKALKQISTDIREVYCPTGVAMMEESMGLNDVYAMDLTTGWDFTATVHQQAASDYIKRMKPKIVIGSPMCSLLNSLSNSSRMGDLCEKFTEAKEHIRFVIGLYEQQSREGRWFLHEHTSGATSWDLEEVKNLENKAGVDLYIADQSVYGSEIGRSNRGAAKPAMRMTRFMTNSIEICIELQKSRGDGIDDRLCRAKSVDGVQREVIVCDGKDSLGVSLSTCSTWSSRYPAEVCKAISRGLWMQNRMEKQNLKILANINVEDTIQEYNADGSESRSQEVSHEEEGQAWDDRTGESLDPKEVRKARSIEMAYVRSKGVWEKISRSEACRRGIKIIQTRWLDINKGDMWNPNYRSRFVGKEYNNGKNGDVSWFAATPPLEALKLIVSDAATFHRGKKYKAIMINDVARAFFEAPVQRLICIELPDEDLKKGERHEDVVGLLKMSFYGTRDAASNFQNEVKIFMQGVGFRAGKYNTCTYWHCDRDIKTMVHGDDFVSSGAEEELRWLEAQMKGRFEIKTQILGHGQNLEKEGKILNRVLRVTEKGWEYEADQRHGEIIVRAMGLDCAKGVSSPGEELMKWQEDEDEKLLEQRLSSEYRAIAARANFLAMDRPDIQYPVKEICRAMSNPTVGDKKKLKRLARYLLQVPRIVSHFEFQELARELIGFSDSDWAGCKKTAKSTSGGVIMVAKHCIKSWSATQKNITLSSAEAELVAAVKMSSEIIGMLQLLADWGVTMEARVYVDSSAAIGVTQRRGNGKLRHVRVGTLWIQEKVESGELQIFKVSGTSNPADAMTKYLSGKRIQELMWSISQEGRNGRSDLSLRVHA